MYATNDTKNILKIKMLMFTLKNKLRRETGGIIKIGVLIFLYNIAYVS